MIMTDQSRKVRTGRVLLCTKSILMVLEPFQGSKAERLVGRVPKDQAVPGLGFIEPAQPFTETSKLLVKIWMRCHTERLVGKCLAIDCDICLDAVW